MTGPDWVQFDNVQILMYTGRILALCTTRQLVDVPSPGHSADCQGETNQGNPSLRCQHGGGRLPWVDLLQIRADLMLVFQCRQWMSRLEERRMSAVCVTRIFFLGQEVLRVESGGQV